MIIVTGANGFIGSAFVWELNRAGFGDAIACVDAVEVEARPRLLQGKTWGRFLRHDQIWDFLNLPDTQRQVRWVVHLGASSSTTETNLQFLWENNTLYSQRLFQWCAEHGKNLIYASSAATYGAGELGYDDRVDPEQLQALNGYGHSKLAMDRWAFRQASQPPAWYGLRFFNVYGPNEYYKGAQSSVVLKAFEQIRGHGRLSLFKSYREEYPNGGQMRDFVYVKDVTAWMLELMENKTASGIYNMGFGRPRTWLDLARATFHSMGREPKIDWIEIPDNIRDHYQYFTEARMEKWYTQGRSHPRWNLEDGIHDYVSRYLAPGGLIL
jgi:ADP-L-glycero-D-manno-heptose 6-epimerase